MSTSNRLLQIKASFIQSDVWLVELHGREGYSYEGEFELMLLTRSSHDDLSSWIKQNVFFSIHPRDQAARYFNVVIIEVKELEPVGSYAFYRIVASSVLRLLSYEKHCRSFLNKSNPDVVWDVLQKNAVHNCNLHQITQSYAPHDYTVQYNETDLAFITRLLADAGIFYWIDYATQTVFFGDSIRSYRLQENHISCLNESVITTTAMDQTVELTTDSVSISLGQLIKVPHINAGSTLIPTDICHQARDYGGLPVTVSSAQQEMPHYSNQVKAVFDKAQPYMPTSLYDAPKISGVFQGKVVGLNRQDLHANQQGQVRLWFSWDENNPHKILEKCPWVNVRYDFAANGFEQQFIPHVGQSVWVMYLDDCANTPVIVGAVYDESNAPPFNLSHDAAYSGFKTHAGHANSERIVLSSVNDLECATNESHMRHIKGYDYIDVFGDALEAVLSGSYSLEATKSIQLKSGSSSITITPEKIEVCATDIYFKTSKSLSANQFAHVGMAHSCPSHGDGPILEGAYNVKVKNKPVSCVGDIAKCGGAIDRLIQGHPDLYVNGKQVAYINSRTEHGGHVVGG